jgi:hypothetical protein
MLMCRVTILVFVLLGAGCRPSDAVVEKIANDEVERVAEAYIEQITQGDFAAVERDLDASLRGPNTMAAFREMRRLVPPGDPIRKSLAGYHWSKTLSGSSATYELVYEYEYSVGFCIWELKLSEVTTGKYLITHFRVIPVAQSLREQHRFALLEKGPGHWLFLTAMIAVPGFILGSLISCIRTPFKRRKWLWIIFILVGLAQFTFNWSTGQLHLRPLSFALLGSGFTSQGVYGPWILSTSVPLGAITYWIRRKKIKGQAPPELPDGETDSADGQDDRNDP